MTILIFGSLLMWGAYSVFGVGGAWPVFCLMVFGWWVTGVVRSY